MRPSAGRRVHWWRGYPNFGDLLTARLLKRFSGITPVWAELGQAELVVVGSVLEGLPDRWSGTILGAGKLRESPTRDLSQARILAVRGPLSAACVRGDVSGAVLGDPGLLVPDLLPRRPEPRYEVGFVRHWSDTSLVRSARGRLVIDTLSTDPLDVLYQIAQCRTIVSSSLHGLIAADALDIPAMPRLGSGLDWKTRDYHESLSVKHEMGTMRTVPRSAVERLQRELRRAFNEIRSNA